MNFVAFRLIFDSLIKNDQKVVDTLFVFAELEVSD
jgi:hypothetical protein